MGFSWICLDEERWKMADKRRNLFPFHILVIIIGVFKSFRAIGAFFVNGGYPGFSVNVDQREIRLRFRIERKKDSKNKNLNKLNQS